MPSTVPCVVLAPDKFKGSLSAPDVARHLADGIVDKLPSTEVRIAPVADGGDGTLDAALSAGFERLPVTATGPTGEPVSTAVAIRGDVAVVELADVSGLRRLPDGRFAPLTATSYGFGELIRAALDADCRRLVLGIGGSACTDGGAGMAKALGARLFDADGDELAPGGAALLRLRRIDVTGVDPRLAETEVVVASDVDNPLLGPSGAAEVYGPQKGASPADVEVLERGLGTLADCVEHQLGIDAKDRPGAGAAGGVGYGCMVFLHATLRPGIAFLLDLLRFPQTLDGAQLVVTGEGALDTQSLHGKAPVGVANAARAAGLPVIAVAGRSTLSAAQLAQAGFAAAYALSDLEPDPTLSMANAGELLHRVGQQIATDWLHRSEVVP